MMIGTMTQSTGSRSAMEIELTKLSSPRIFLVRMLVFLVLCSLLLVVLYKQIVTAFFANPGLNALIGAVLLIGIILSFRQVIRLYPEVAWVNNFRIADPGLGPRESLPDPAGADGGDPRRRAYRPDDRSRSRPCGISWIPSRRGSTRRATSPAT